MSKEEIFEVIEVLKRGGVILYPTDTIWGLGCDPTNPKAVKRIFDIKQRSESKSMLLLAKDMSMVEKYVMTVPDIAYELVEVSEDKPVTIIYPNAAGVAESLIAEDNSIGIRVVRDDFCQGVLRGFKKPIVSTSANISGKPSPSYFDQIEKEIINAVDYVVKWRQNDKQPKQPSSIIKLLSNGEFTIIRK